MPWRRITAVLATLVVACCTSCSGPSQQLSDKIALVENGNHRMLVHRDHPGASADAALEGPLTLSQDSCLGVGSSALVLFRYGTRWLGPDTVLLDGKAVRLGDSVTVGGGVNENPADLAVVRTACPNVSKIFDTQ